MDCTTHANQVAEFGYVTFNRGCANSSVYMYIYGDCHGISRQGSQGRIRYETLIPKQRGVVEAFISVLCAYQLQEKLSLIRLVSRHNSTVLYCAALRSLYKSWIHRHQDPILAMAMGVWIHIALHFCLSHEARTRLAQGIISMFMVTLCCALYVTHQ